MRVLTLRARYTLALWSLQAVLVLVAVLYVMPRGDAPRRPAASDEHATTRCDEADCAQQLARRVADEARALGLHASLLATRPGHELEAVATALEAWDMLGAMPDAPRGQAGAHAHPEVLAGLLASQTAWRARPTFEHASPTDAALSPDGTTLAVADPDGASIYSVHTGARIGRVAHATDGLTGVRFSADGRRLVTFAHDRLDAPFVAAREPGSAEPPRIWTATGHLVAELEEPGTGAIDAAIADDGTLVLGGDDGRAWVYDLDTGAGRFVLPGHRGRVGTVAIARDGSRIVTVSHVAADGDGGTAAGGTLAVWHGDGSRRLAIELEDRFTGAVVSADLRRAATFGGTPGRVVVWDLERGRALATLELERAERIHQVALADDGARLAVISWHRLEVFTLEPVSGERVRSSRLGAAIRSEHALTDVTFAPGGARLATTSTDGELREWDATSLAMLAVRSGHRDLVAMVRYSARGDTLLTIGHDERARLWVDEPVGRAAGALDSGPFDLSVHASIEARAQRLRHGTRIELVNRVTGARVSDFEVAVQDVVGLRLGAGLVVHLRDARGHAHAFDALTGQRRHVAPPERLRASHGAVAVRGLTPSAQTMLVEQMLGPNQRGSASASADGQWLAIWNEAPSTAVALWDRRTRREVARLDHHATPPVEVLFAPDAALVATVESDGTTHLWALPSATHLATVPGTWRGHTAPNAHFDQDGRALAVGDHLLFPLRAPELVDSLCITLRDAPRAGSRAGVARSCAR